MRRINPIANEADDIVKVVRRLEDAIRALHQVADLLPLLLANNAAESTTTTTDGSTEGTVEGTPQGATPGKEVDHADPPGEPDRLHRGPGTGGSAPTQ